MNPYRPLPPPTAPCRGEQGFALITVLWLIAILTTLVGFSLSSIRLGNQTTANRIALTRGRWAAEACFAIAQNRRRQGKLTDTATIDLGRGTRCSWRLEDPTARINVNAADSEVLQGLDSSAGFVRSLLAARRAAPLQNIDQLTELPGFDSTRASLWTVDGPGSVNLAAASPAVLRALPGLSAEAVERIIYGRSVGRPYASLDAVAAQLSPPARGMLLARYGDLARVVTFSAPVLVVTVTGWVTSEPPRATIEYLVVPLPERLAVARRRQW